MFAFIQKHYNLSEVETWRIVGEDDDKTVVERLLAWEDNYHERQINDTLFCKALPQLKLQQHRVFLEPWAEKWKMLPLLEKCSLFEFELARTENPYYLQAAFNVPFAACTDLGIFCNLSVSTDAVRYAIVLEHILPNRVMRVDEANNRFICENIGSGDVSNMDPFPVRILRGHPLEDVDVDSMPPCEVAQYLNHKGELLERIREKTNAVNRICKIDGLYMFKFDTKGCVSRIRALAEICF